MVNQGSTQTNEKAEFRFDGKTVELPVVVGTEKEKAVDISELRAKTSYITLDQGYANTGTCLSAITFIDGDKGILRYRGIPIEQLAEQSTFVETAYLLINGKLPTKAEADFFSKQLTENASLHQDVKHIFDGIPSATHPMATLSAMVSILSGFDGAPGESTKRQTEAEVNNRIAAKLLSKVRTIAAYSYKKSIGQPFIYPHRALNYCANFLHMMFSLPGEEHPIDEEAVHVLNLLLILHADHEQNCSTSTVRLVGSSQSSLFACIAAGICALWGPWHGGANQEVMEMLEEIHRTGGDINKYVAAAKDPNSPVRLSGFGHRVYKTYDPRAKVIKQACDRYFKKRGVNDPLLEIAFKLEEVALNDDFFISRKLYPNVDFYSGILYRALGIPTDMFPVMFAIGRLPGWIAHWKEMRETKPMKIGRPRQIYIGPLKTDYVPIEKRS